MVPISSRRPSVPVFVQKIPIGGEHPIVVQSMTNTDTEDARSTADQVYDLWRAGSELVRITVNTEKAARAVPEIRNILRDRGAEVPLIGDFHFNGHILLQKVPDAAETLSKYRINPGTLGGRHRKDDNFRTMVAIARDRQKPVRIGVNWGSLDPAILAERMDVNARREEPLPASEVMREAIVESAVRSSEMAMEEGLGEDQIILSAKVSHVPDLILLYRDLANRTRFPLHLGLTEAGMGDKGIIASTLGIGTLLAEGIGDTIRVSLTPFPGESRTREVEVCQQILQSLGLRNFFPQITSCPGCGRTTSTFFQELTEEIRTFIMGRLPQWRITNPGVENLTIAVMGCVVNGPGESRQAHIGISLPGTGEQPRAPVFIEGKLHTTLQGPSLVHDFEEILESYVQKKFPESTE
ncbi:MAG TPA: flavodoxin-dependent (E)-4-hydroxy-3-methylbut-2-enyl-diphosphate synthase [Thermoanaerobaculia bacterium]|nr:flavodoxin-dependent (E)-4-hydroxy-3-methylbut-2-enyl-diphosphate synthase [Thermoanaerobaculia bacterium]HUM29098.1 flavodoxin-dependent (E)-4-hydroxy-3-methylbut-2-enyl-diphosphate synthase [Thermoanaerobaculia bacterium]HXK67475.1 flavodoxin-dependent (E)-4-hydroxy-3-methylbut-2-enyl-diphosphate synthase [Thermoanaerobaculia bacterium]